MTRNQKLVSTGAGTFGRSRNSVAGTLALAMLSPVGAFALDSKPKETFDRACCVLPLPSIRHLDSMRWMDWKPSTPVFRVDTLLLPDRTQPGVFRLPSYYEPDLPRIS